VQTERAKQIFLAPLVLLSITVAVHWKTLLTDQYQEFDKPDLTYQVAPWLQAQATQWHQRRPMLWDPYQVGGQSLIGQAQPGTAYPLNWILFLMPLKNGFIRDAVLNWYMAIIRFLGALFCYLLCRDLGRSVPASILGGCGFAFAGYIATTAWPQMLSGAIWGPLVLLFSLRSMKGERPLVNSIFSGAFLGISWLSGHHQIPIYILLTISGLWIYHSARERNVKHVACLVALIATMVLVGALQIFPAYSYARTSVRWVNASHELTWREPVPHSVHDEFSLDPALLPGVFLDSLFAHSNPFVGIVVLSLSLLGIALAWSEFPVRLLTATAIGGLVFGFSGATVLHGIVYALVPFVDKARSPAMAVFIFHLSIVVLAAFGADVLTSQPHSAWVKRTIVGCGSIGVLIWIFEVIVASFHTPLTARAAPIAITGLCALFLVALLNALRSGTVQASSSLILLIALVILEIGSLTQADLINRDQGFRYWTLLSRDRDVAHFLRARPGPYRTDFKEEDVPYNFGDWYGIESYMGFVASAPTAFIRIQGYPRAHDLFGVRYYVAREAPRPGLTEVFSSASGLKVFEIPTAMPRAWAVHETFPIHGLDELGPHLNHPSLDFNRTILLMGTLPQLETCSGDEVRLVRHDARRAIIDVNMNCRGIVVLGDGYSKDWVATVDQKTRPIYAAYGVVRGVLLDRGHHRVEFVYRPASVYIGGGMTGVSLACIGLLFMSGRKSKNASRDT
jgi:hypothetical protein